MRTKTIRISLIGATLITFFFGNLLLAGSSWEQVRPGKCVNGDLTYVRTIIAQIGEKYDAVILSLLYEDSFFKLKRDTPGFEESFSVAKRAAQPSEYIYVLLNERTREILSVTFQPESFCNLY